MVKSTSDRYTRIYHFQSSLLVSIMAHAFKVQLHLAVCWLGCLCACVGVPGCGFVPVCVGGRGAGVSNHGTANFPMSLPKFANQSGTFGHVIACVPENLLQYSSSKMSLFHGLHLLNNVPLKKQTAVPPVCQRKETFLDTFK